MKKGFTLIELLAVIVILAIIALIATPIIINIINDSQKSAATNSAQLYVDGLTKKVMSENMSGEFNPSSCTITNGNITCDGETIDYTVDGDKPTSGTITFNNGIVTGYQLYISGYTVTKSGSTITTVKGEPTPAYTAYTMGQLIQYDPVNNGTCTTGETCYKWRVITVGDTTSNPTITLQMDHNLINVSAWVTQVDYDDDTNYGYNGNTNKGPITALKALETATSTWADSLKLNYTYDTSAATNNYGTLSCTNGACTVAGSQITSNLKARMITVEEITEITKAAGAASGTNAYNWTIASDNYYYFSNSEYILGTTDIVEEGQIGSNELSWLVENTMVDSSSGATDNTYESNSVGYWTLTPQSGYSSYAWYVANYGPLQVDNVYRVSGVFTYGLRPVIAISKSAL